MSKTVELLDREQITLADRADCPLRDDCIECEENDKHELVCCLQHCFACRDECME